MHPDTSVTANRFAPNTMAGRPAAPHNAMPLHAIRLRGCCLTGLLPAVLVLLLWPLDAYARGAWGHSPRGGGVRNPMAAWLAREARAEAVRRLKNAEQQFAGAIKAQKDGKVWLAATLYMRVALARPKNRHSGQAKQALAAMANEGRAQMKKAQQLLDSGEVETAFKQLDHLAREYENVPRFNHEVAERVQKLRHDPKYKAALDEPRAAALVDEAQRCEAAGEICCAFIAYEEAAKLLPAPSAKRAEERWTAMKRDPEIVAEAETCLKVRECLRMFHTAELLAKTSPGPAEDMFKKVVARSPADSEVHRCAQEELAKLRGHGKKAKSS